MLYVNATKNTMYQISHSFINIFEIKQFFLEKNIYDIVLSLSSDYLQSVL